MVAARAHRGWIRAVVGRAGGLVCGRVVLEVCLPLFCVLQGRLCVLTLTREHSRYRLVDVIKQVKGYPADEQWVAVSTDAYNLLDSEWQEVLRAACQREGIGLLRVRSATHVELLETPRPRRPRKVSKQHGVFLACYSRSNVIRQKLRDKA